MIKRTAAEVKEIVRVAREKSEIPDLRGSDLSFSNLRDSDLSFSDLSGSNLSGSNLRDSDLSYSDLRGSNLRGSNLRGSDLSGANIDFSCWPLWCGSSNVKIDEKQARQLMAHAMHAARDFFCPTPEQAAWANEFHRIISREFPKIKGGVK